MWNARFGAWGLMGTRSLIVILSDSEGSRDGDARLVIRYARHVTPALCRGQLLDPSCYPGIRRDDIRKFRNI